MSTLTSPRRRSRVIVPAVAAVLSALLGFFALTALGVGGGGGGGGRDGGGSAGIAPGQHPAPTPLQAYSHEAGLRGGAGIAAGGRPISELVPLTPSDFAPAFAAYRRYAGRQLVAVAAAARRLVQALAAGRRGTARADWLAAYGSYLRLGAVYGEFGDLDTAIDGTPGGLAGGTASRRFTGLHRLELGLWTGAPTRSLVPTAERLVADVGRLERLVPTVAITPLEYATRAHEILEDAQRDLLSGTAVPWSRAGVFATAAGLAATEEVLGTLRPLLDGRGNAIEDVDYAFVRLRAAIAEIRAAHGASGWPTNDQLTQSESERLGGTLGYALEQLAAVPGALETQLPPAVPALSAAAGSRQ